MPELGKTQPFLAADNINLTLCNLHDFCGFPVLLILLMAHLKPSKSRLLEEVPASMKSEVTMAAKNDELIMKYGANTVEKLGGNVQEYAGNAPCV